MRGSMLNQWLSGIHMMVDKVRYDFGLIPKKLKWMSLMMFVMVIGRGLGGDTFFSVYLSGIVSDPFLVSVLGSLLALSKLLFTIPVGELDDKSDISKILGLGKLIYIACAVFYALAGRLNSVGMVFVAVLLNGIASTIVFTTYSAFYREHSSARNSSGVYGLFVSSINAGYVVGGLGAAFLVQYFALPSLFVFVALFTGLSLIGWRKLEEDVNPIVKDTVKHLGFFRQFFGSIFGVEPYRRAWSVLKTYGKKTHQMLGYLMLMKGVDYVAFLFVPLLAVQHELGLSQVALLFVVMRVPYVFSYLLADREDSLNKETLLTWLFGVLGTLFVGLSFASGFWLILFLSFLMAFVFSALTPLINGMLSGDFRKKDLIVMSSVTSALAKVGEIVLSILFGCLIAWVGMSVSFAVIAIVLVGLFIGRYFFSK